MHNLLAQPLEGETCRELMTSVCRPEAVQALWNPVCTMGQVPSSWEPLFGG